MRPLSWIAAFLAYMAADLLTGSTIEKSAVLTCPNLAGIAAALAIFRRLPPEHLALSRPFSVIIMVCAIAFGCAVAGIFGIFAGSYLFGLDYVDAFVFWSVSEMVNYVAILPAILTLPAFSPAHLLRLRGRRSDANRITAAKLAPLIAVLLSLIAGGMIGGPGAISFPVLALLWAALAYTIFVNSLLAFLFTAWTLIAIAKGHLPIVMNMEDLREVLSLRIGVMLIALAPLMVASVMASRNELLERLRALAVTDHLTGALNRNGLFQLGTLLFSRLHADRDSVAVLMIDIDHFKAVNDTYGHPAGDAVLRAMAQTLRANLRAGDQLGRVGGEEFCVLLERPGSVDATELADRLCRAARELVVALPGHAPLSVTISVGVAAAAQAPQTPDDLISAADRALYRAKQEGRDRFVLAEAD